MDQILCFASKDSDLSIRHAVKRRLTTRDEVQHYILGKMKDDKDAQRLESSEIVLKKFGLLDRDFHLQPFIVSLLTEQIAGYYDSKTKTVNMLDWIAPDEQKPVLAHELTHALQDQHVDLEKWSDQSKESTAKNVDEDNDHLRMDEADTAREAVAEGQAMVVFLDWGLGAEGTVAGEAAGYCSATGRPGRRRQRFAGDEAGSAAAEGVAVVSLSRGTELRAGGAEG